MNLVGQLVEKESGGSYLELNVLTAAERAALMSICPATASKKANWDAAVDALAKSAVIPSVRNTTAQFEVECKRHFNYIFPFEKARDNWLEYIKTNAVPVAASDGVHYAVTSTNGAAYVDADTTPVATPRASSISSGSTRRPTPTGRFRPTRIPPRGRKRRFTPFAQRVEDFYSNPSDISFTMLEQIGRPYQGDVALSNENLTEVGLLELYQTIFNKAESILIAAGGENVDLSKQLILATTRMGEFYSLLGAEAYSDAKNPLVASADGTTDSAATICRHSTLRAGNDFTSTRLVGRSVWNDRWLLVIPASSLNADRARALDTFINGVGDIKIGIKAYSRSGN